MLHVQKPARRALFLLHSSDIHNMITSWMKFENFCPLHDPVTWYGKKYAGTQVTHWDFQNKGKSGWTGTSSFVLEAPLRYLRPSIIYSVPCDRGIVQRAYSAALLM